MVSVKGDYQSLPIDGYYNEMLGKVYKDGELFIDADAMDKESLLGNIYQKEKVKYAKVFFLKRNKKGFLFCTVATSYDHNKMDTTEHKVAFKIAVSKIKERI